MNISDSNASLQQELELFETSLIKISEDTSSLQEENVHEQELGKPLLTTLTNISEDIYSLQQEHVVQDRELHGTLNDRKEIHNMTNDLDINPFYDETQHDTDKDPLA